ncbi:MAG: RICIN domain-containing protein [Bacteroidota bacterium]
MNNKTDFVYLKVGLFVCFSFLTLSLSAQIKEAKAYFIEGENGRFIVGNNDIGTCINVQSNKRSKWRFEKAENENYYYLGLDKCDDYLTDVGNKPGILKFLNQVRLYNKDNTTNQQWEIIEEDGKYLFKNRQSGRYLMAHLANKTAKCPYPVRTIDSAQRSQVSTFKRASQWEVSNAGSLFDFPSYTVPDSLLLDYEILVRKVSGKHFVTLNGEKWLNRTEQVQLSPASSGQKPQVVTQTVIPDNVYSYHWRIFREGCPYDESSHKVVDFCTEHHNRPFEHTFSVPEEGIYVIEFSLKKWDPLLDSLVEIRAVERRIRIKDFLIVALGDSVASGEGNPDKPRRLNCKKDFLSEPCRKCEWIRMHQNQFWELNTTAAEWKEPLAHRSNNAYPVLAADKFSKERPNNLFTTTSLFHEAATGASVAKGLLATQGWQATGQIKTVRDKIGQRRIDFLTISIGANDIGFSSGIRKLTAGEKFYKNNDINQLIADTRLKISQLDSSFYELDKMLKDSLNIQHILVTEYPNSFFDNRSGEAEKGCGFFHGKLIVKEISTADARGIKLLANELNQKIRQLADELGWIYVDGIVERFAGHGYCTEENSFYVGAEKSCKGQGDLLGVLHPNLNGQMAYANALLTKMDSLIPSIFLPEEPCLGSHNIRRKNTVTFSLQRDFPDLLQQFRQLGQLNYPERYYPVSFEITPSLLGENLSNRKITKVAMEFITQNGLPPMAIQLYFASKQLNNRMTFDGLIDSTPSVPEEDWSDILGFSPIQDWILGVPNNETVHQWFEQNVIRDITLTISYTGRIN